MLMCIIKWRRGGGRKQKMLKKCCFVEAKTGPGCLQETVWLSESGGVGEGREGEPLPSGLVAWGLGGLEGSVGQWLSLQALRHKASADFMNFDADYPIRYGMI